MNTPNPASSGRRPPHGVLYGCAMVLLLCACDAAESRKSLTQVAARVNGEEISIHQANVVLSRVQGEPGTTPERLRQEVLDKLVDQQVLYAQAVEKKMDRDPQVMMLVDAARREIVARAYMDSLLAGQGKAAASEVHQYYVENPALFAQRKIYNLVEITLPARRDWAVRAGLASGRISAAGAVLPLTCSAPVSAAIAGGSAPASTDGALLASGGGGFRSTLATPGSVISWSSV